MRDLTTALRTATEANKITPILMVEFDFPSGFARAWTGLGDLVWDSKTFKGTGDFGEVSGIEESAEVAAKGASFRLSGIPTEWITVALSEAYQGRPARLWLGAFEAGGLIADPYLLFAGRMDVIELQDAGETASLTLTAESRLIDLNRSRERRYTDEDQRIDYPEDEGLKFIAGLQNRTLLWGQKGNSAGGGSNVDNGDES